MGPLVSFSNRAALPIIEMQYLLTYLLNFTSNICVEWAVDHFGLGLI